MSNRWPGGLIRKTPVTPTGPYQNGTASGVWSMADAAYWVKQGLWPTAGNISPTDLFATALYNSTGANQTITNGINLSANGGMVIFRARTGTNASYGAGVFDTARGVNKGLRASGTDASLTDTTSLTAFNSNGVSIGQDDNVYVANTFSGGTSVAWTFRKATSFFDVLTYSGNGSARTISHNLGATPGCIIVKRTDTTSDWAVYHRGNTSAAYYEKLNSTAAQASDSTVWNSTAPTSSVFSVGTSTLTNASGGSYVAYLFGHGAIIQCGSYSGTAALQTVNCGFTTGARFVLIKRADSTGDWYVWDSTRGISSGNDPYLLLNTTGAEVTGTNYVDTDTTGFKVTAAAPAALNASGGTFIYIAVM